jgi:hypothetical protein
MTPGTIRTVFAGRKLSRVRVLMASEALLGCRAEIDAFQTRLKHWRPVAIATGRASVGAQKREFRF